MKAVVLVHTLITPTFSFRMRERAVTRLDKRLYVHRRHRWLLQQQQNLSKTEKPASQRLFPVLQNQFKQGMSVLGVRQQMCDAILSRQPVRRQRRARRHQGPISNGSATISQVHRTTIAAYDEQWSTTEVVVQRRPQRCTGLPEHQH